MGATVSTGVSFGTRKTTNTEGTPTGAAPISEIAQQHIETEVEKLIQKEAVLAVSAIPNQFISSIFAVPKKDGSQRPVVNLKPLNTFVKKIHSRWKEFT